jgi:hypothetical protein
MNGSGGRKHAILPQVGVAIPESSHLSGRPLLQARTKPVMPPCVTKVRGGSIPTTTNIACAFLQFLPEQNRMRSVAGCVVSEVSASEAHPPSVKNYRRAAQIVLVDDEHMQLFATQSARNHALPFCRSAQKGVAA